MFRQYASAEPKIQEAKPSRKSTVTKGADSTGSKAATIGVVDTTNGVTLQNGSLHESTAKKSDAFIIDFDDQSAEGDTVPSKKPPMKKSSSNVRPILILLKKVQYKHYFKFFLLHRPNGMNNKDPFLWTIVLFKINRYECNYIKHRFLCVICINRIKNSSLKSGAKSI